MPRRGRPIKYYQAVADGFYVPFNVTPYASVETLSPGSSENLQTLLDLSISKAWTETAGEPRALGIHLYRGEDGKISRNITPYPDKAKPNRFFEALIKPDSPAVWDTWGIRRLNAKEAKKLQQELASVFERYKRDEKEENKEYIIRLAMAPVFE